MFYLVRRNGSPKQIERDHKVIGELMPQFTKTLKFCFSLFIILFSTFALAQEREAKYLLEVKGSNEIIYVDRPAQFSYDFRVYKGEPGNLQQLEVSDVAQYRDGGTTIISLKDGSSIYVPTPSKKNESATFTPISGSVQELDRMVTDADSLAEKRIDPSNPLKAKPVSTVIADNAISVKSAAEVNEKSNPLEARDVEIDQAFRDTKGNLIIRFRYGAKSIGTNMTFWGPHQEGLLFQLQERGFSGSLVEYEISFLAPSEENPERAAKIQVTKSGELTVSCEGGARCFRRMNEGEERALETTIRSGILGLEGLPHIRTVEYIFQIEGTNRYVVVDSPKFNYSYDFQVYVGEKGSMEKVDVVDVFRYRDGGTTIIRLADGSEIYSPTPFKKEEKPTLTDSSGKRLMIAKERSVDFLRSELSMNTSKFQMTSLRTPVNRCMMLFSGGQ